MARMLDFFLDRKTNRVCAKYADSEALYLGLEQEASEAIQCLSAKVSGSIYTIGKGYRLTDDDIEELICDCITICLQKIRTGKYVFQGYSPSTFVIEIAKNRARNFKRTALRHDTTDLENVGETSDESDDFGSLADTELLEKLLRQIDTNCQNLIRLKYLEEYRDKDVIDQKMTQYTTVDALKNHRSKCMKKLVEIASNASLLQS
jgi:DNA-directed RNA polymerase specialized sigma24 family protein